MARGKIPLKLTPREEGFRAVVGEQTWELHPDGHGYRPKDAHRRGAIEMPCPHCGSPLVREGSEEIIRTTVFGCGQCHRPSTGPDVREPPSAAKGR